MRHRGDDLVASRLYRREVAVAETGDLDRVGMLREQIASAEAVAHRPRADAVRVRRHLQERIEGHDLVHLSAPDVHVVGEGVRKLGSDRPHFSPDAAEVVQQARARRRKLGRAREPHRIHASILRGRRP